MEVADMSALRTPARTGEPNAIVVTLRDRHMAILDQATVENRSDAYKAALLILSRRGELHPGESIRVMGTYDGAQATQVARETD
jgi:hypothetical protein